MPKRSDKVNEKCLGPRGGDFWPTGGSKDDDVIKGDGVMWEVEKGYTPLFGIWPPGCHS